MMWIKHSTHNLTECRTAGETKRLFWFLTVVMVTEWQSISNSNENLFRWSILNYLNSLFI